MNLYELRDRINRVIQQNEAAGWSDRNELPVNIKIRQPRTPTGRHRPSVNIPLKDVENGLFTDGAKRKSGASLRGTATTADQKPLGTWVEDPASELGNRQKYVLKRFQEQGGVFYEGDWSRRLTEIEDILNSLKARGLVEEDENRVMHWELTDEGQELAAKLFAEV